MIPCYEEYDQQRLEAEALYAREQDAENQGTINKDGEWDAFLGYPPKKEYWADYAYRDGYLKGVAKRYDKMYQPALAEPF